MQQIGGECENRLGQVVAVNSVRSYRAFCRLIEIAMLWGRETSEKERRMSWPPMKDRSPVKSLWYELQNISTIILIIYP